MMESRIRAIANKIANSFMRVSTSFKQTIENTFERVNINNNGQLELII
ncbi:hypothetical protein ACFFHH_20360 [Cytobacillus solani]|nr:hypothetical protein [Cytobacillus solani]USK54229.1 hypothetical protein LIS82_22110 [Cytobacillus solani]